MDGIFSSPPLCSLLGRSSSSVGARRPLPERGRGEERRGEEARAGRLVRVAAGVLVFPAGLFRREYFLVYLYRHACTREQCGITSLISSNQAVIFFLRKKFHERQHQMAWKGVAAPNRRNGTASWRRAFLLGARARRAPRVRFRSLGAGARWWWPGNATT